MFFQKRCAAHGVQKTLIADDLAYWKCQRDWVKPGDRPLALQSRTEHGCPYDCGLCPDHEQHSCLAIVEINDACNLTCPVCFAGSAVGRGGHRPLAEIEAMLDAVVASEGEPDLVQLSGGEPTIHPQFFEVLAAAKARPIRHLMINTNGLAIAREPGFAERLADVHARPGGLPAGRLAAARGADGPARRRPDEGADRSAGGAGAGGRLHHAGRHGEEGRQRRGHRPADPLRPAVALRAGRHLPAGAGRRPQRRLRARPPPHGADRDPPPRRRGRRLRPRRHDPAALQPRPDLASATACATAAT